MKLNTGKIAFPIEFDNGDKAVIYFNPNDPDLMIRTRNFGDNIKNKIDNMEDFEVSNDGTPIELNNIDAFEKMQKIVKDELDFAFGGDVSEVVFKHCSPFAIVNGEYFITQFIDAITPEIEKCIQKAKKESEKKMNKYLDKYSK